MPPSKAEPIWSKFLDYENKYGDLQGIQSVEKRRKEAIPSSKWWKWVLTEQGRVTILLDFSIYLELFPSEI